MESKTFSKFIHALDHEILDLESEVKYLITDRDIWRKRCQELESEKLQDINNMVAHTLTACISTPDINSFSPAAAIVLAKIRDMDNVKEIHDYINSICQQVITDEK